MRSRPTGSGRSRRANEARSGAGVRLLRPSLLLLGAAVAAKASSADASERAAAIFAEGRHVQATLRGDDQALPADTMRCRNCHEGAGHRLPDARRAAEAGPPLTAATLVVPRSRRGGPPSRYDQGSFCRLLRQGIDPADIVVRRTMPIYRIEPSDCAALWRLLSGGEAR